jgi:hypothetical protein
VTCAWIHKRHEQPLFPDPLTGQWFDLPDQPANSRPDAWDLHLCPRAQIDSSIWTLVSAWLAYRWGGMAAGPLPALGGTLDQTVHWIEGTAILDSVKNDLDAHPPPRNDD